MQAGQEKVGNKREGGRREGKDRSVTRRCGRENDEGEGTALRREPRRRESMWCEKGRILLLEGETAPRLYDEAERVSKHEGASGQQCWALTCH